MNPSRPRGPQGTPPHAAGTTANTRIIGHAVTPLVPARGAVHVLLVGEAPGPRGADKSGVPFFGDAAGMPLYAVLREMGAVTLPGAVDDLPWDGEIFHDGGLQPVANRIALGNAFDRCPTDDFIAFRPPTRAELTSDANIARLANDIEALLVRDLRGIVAMGRVADTTIDVVLKRMVSALPTASQQRDRLLALTRRAVVHPSARGLLSLLPGRGTGAKMVELRAQWKVMLETAVREAGFGG